MNQDDDTLDRPIRPLAELEQEVGSQFLSGLRKKIYRRTAANQVAAFSWNLPRVIFIELLTLISHFLQNAGGKKA